MSAIEFNKFAGAVLFALLAMFGARTVSNIVFHPSSHEKPGWILTEGEGEGAAGESAGAAAPEVPLAQLLSEADADKGQSVAKKCAACHTFDKGGANRVGPNLYGVVGRNAGSVAGFAYSDVIQSKGTWTYEALDAFLADPKADAPGTKMSFAGVKKPGQRADLIVYLRNQTDSPPPLPKPEPKAESGAAPAAEKSAGAGGEKPAAAQAGAQGEGAGGAPKKGGAGGKAETEQAGPSGQAADAPKPDGSGKPAAGSQPAQPAAPADQGARAAPPKEEAPSPAH